ncbi:MAG TPA: ABC transporter ATP-binding protein [Pseudothermotoga sp.]|uniref:ABC transporter ATP-binding protein n=1 Tax=Pseudothermotoga lettingae TaxID=177758 RepID=UPI0007476B87|nr:ABC transporter ATP-binding protein [Pseudothermotoga lettingae]KUK21152.1 MAG: ABC transporter related [Pseudothermotoga lettingae]HBT26618.1 ABC transporter ATP-binding protein [Pseudothermotoga sp.]
MIKISNLRKQFSGNQVLSDVSFSIDTGSIFALIGPNGAGKTTTIRCILRAIEPDEGIIELFGEPFRWEMKKRIAVVNEDRAVFRNFTARDYAQIWSCLYPSWNDRIFSNFISKYNLNLLQKVESYSIGMKTLFFVGLCVSSQADILILDEPTEHLDPTIRLEIMSILKKYADLGKTILISSHEIYEIEEYATHFGIMKEGRIVYTDSIDTAKEIHRVVEKGESVGDGKIIGVVGSSLLIKTSKDVGRFPKLNDIVIGYLTGRTESTNLFS